MRASTSVLLALSCCLSGYLLATGRFWEYNSPHLACLDRSPPNLTVCRKVVAPQRRTPAAIYRDSVTET
jgi:hypothetical protein